MSGRPLVEHYLLILCIGLAAGAISACTAIPTIIPTAIPPTSTPLSLPGETTTPTIVWFPPTATSTLVPTQAITPTVDVRPSIGGIIFEDDFTKPALWALAASGSSSVALGQREITLAISQPDIYLYSLRDSPVLTNFYAEITASPSICWDEDEYGLLFRVTDALDFYRFSLSCGGAVRLDRYIAGKASSPYPKTYSGAVPPGAPSQSHLAVWVRGKEMHFFVNGEYQFSVNDPAISQGSLGLFARSSKNSAITVSFSSLVVYEVTP
ncbi:MAG: hypothetical protein JW908_09480 [Anaerolineales bacterium]|nr:hypothetical protein [Anaerolineales bacterium]